MVFAALTSLIAQVEVGIRTLMDFGLDRQKSTLLTTGGCFLLGIPSAVIPDFLNNQDWVWGLALLVSGFFTLLAIRRFGPDRVRQEIINPSAEIKMGRWWTIVISYIAPLIFIVLTTWWFYVAITSNPKTWWKPFSVATAGTIIFQWAILLIILILANNFLARKTVTPIEESQK
jgi:NSS family neurotransmitter:Na+ symporter